MEVHNMKANAEKLVNEMNELMNMVVKRVVNVETITASSEEDRAALTLMIKMFDSSGKLLIEEAERLDEINDKLDKVLKKLGTK